MLESIQATPVSGLSIGDLAFQSLEAFKARDKNKWFTLTYCGSVIRDCPKFKDEYVARKNKGGKAAMANEEVREERRSKGKEEKIKIYLYLQTKKFEMEEALKRTKVDIEEAAQLKKVEIDAINVETKAKEVTLAFMSIDKNNMSPERKA
ncbi:Protein IQ-DOMAIN 31 [Hordeum vulgare]|nr:Protein IQ-DOMAIN 31 [Hordeum vulgare]